MVIKTFRLKQGVTTKGPRVECRPPNEIVWPAAPQLIAMPTLVAGEYLFICLNEIVFV